MFQLIEENNMTVTVFQTLMSKMDIFKHEFELKRVIFGLLEIIKTPVSAMPPIVVERLPLIMQSLSNLAQRIHKVRLETLEENEKHVARGGADSDDDGMDDDEDSDFDDDENLKDIQDKIAKAKDKMENGDSEDESDSDYEFNGGDMNLYDSLLDE